MRLEHELLPPLLITPMELPLADPVAMAIPVTLEDVLCRTWLPSVHKPFSNREEKTMQLLRLLLTLTLAVLAPDHTSLAPQPHNVLTITAMYTTYTEIYDITGSLSPFLMTVAITRTFGHTNAHRCNWRRTA